MRPIEKKIDNCRLIIKVLNKNQINFLNKRASILFNKEDYLCVQQFIDYSISNQNESGNYEFVKQFNSLRFMKVFDQFFENVLYSLIEDISEKTRNREIDFFEVKYKATKLHLAILSLHGKKLHRIANILTDDLIKVCKEFELYDILVQTLYFKTIENKVISNEQDKTELLKDIKHYEYCRDSLRKIKIDIQILTTTTYLDTDSKKNIEKIATAIKDTVKFYQKCQSKNIFAILLFQQIEFCLSSDLTNLAQIRIDKLLNLIKNNKCLYSESRINHVNAIRRRVYYKNLNFKFFARRRQNRLSSEEKFWEIQNSIFRGDLNHASKLLIELDLDIIKDQNTILFVKLSSCLGIIDFLKNNFKRFNQILDQLKDLERDKEGWNVWIRIYRILAHIEQKKYDLVDAEIESFRKYMERLGKRSTVRERDQLIVKVLVKLKIEAYRFDKLVQNHSDLLQTLSSKSNECRWQVDSPEKILLHEWIFSKAEKKAYKPDFEPYRKQQQKENARNEEKLKAMPEYKAMGFDL